MSVRPTSAGWLFLAAAVPVVIIVAAALAQPAQPRAEELLRAYLQAGEFAPALALARQVSDPSERDRWLAEIVQAQALAGRRAPRLQSACEIGDDRTAPAAGGVRRPRRGAAGPPAAPPSPTSIRSST